MLPAISQVCSLPSPLEKDIEEYAAGQCRALDAWLTKVEDYLERHTLDDLTHLLDRHGMAIPVASFQGGILASQGEARRAAWELFRSRLDLCRALNIETMVLACDVPRPVTQVDLERVQLSLLEAAREAGRRGRRLALEFQAQAAFGNNLQTAAALVAETGSPHLGLCLDSFHYYVGSSKGEDLQYLTRENLFHVQLSDLLDVPRELAADADRILPGEGDIPLTPVIDRLREIDYQGPVSVEVLNPRLWQIPPRQFGEIAMTSLRRILGLASMS